MESVRRRLVLVHASLVVVIVLGATTAIVALRETREDTERAHAIDRRLAMLDRLRAHTRDVAVSARRHVLSGGIEEQQRVLATVHAMQNERARLQARTTLHEGAVLEADLEEYIAAVMQLMTVEGEDAVARLARFEDELVRIRRPLATTFDEIVAQERAQREALRSSQTLARVAQWAVAIASVLGVLLAVGALVAMLRALRAPAPAAAAREPVMPPTEPSLLR